MGSGFDRQVQEILKSYGCTFVRHGKGSHEIWHSPITNINIAVSHDIRSRHTANAILGFLGKPSIRFRKKQAGAVRARLFCESFLRVPKEPAYHPSKKTSSSPRKRGSSLGASAPIKTTVFQAETPLSLAAQTRGAGSPLTRG